MQFEMNHNIGQQKINVKFSTTLPYDANLQLGVMLCRIGGEMIGDFSWNFPMFITSQVIQEIIHNTCFVCGGLMKNGTAIVNNKIVVESFDSVADTYEGTIEYPDNTSIKQIKVRKCMSCGHSHT